ncbi:MAG: DUF4139 domain-containing protein [Planctomycetota bacterium]
MTQPASVVVMALTITVALACLTASSALAQEGNADRLPVRKVVLYKHGIGSFERRGTVDGNVVVPLSFATAQMKDVLKSLFAVDLGGGHVSTAVYDSQDPIAKQLEDIPYRVPGEPALKGLLAQLQGVRVAVKVGMREARGRVLGTEPEQRQVGDAVVTSHRVVLLRDDGGIETLPLLDAEAVEVLDAEVRSDLGRMMEVLGKARHADRKTLQLRAQGEGPRELRVGYILETPVWKTSYRLLLDDAGPPVLQGWAIVENRTDEDWNDVELTFVAGSPMSFVMDLYTSYYPPRPVLDVNQGNATVAPPEAEAAEGESQFDSGRFGARVRGMAAGPSSPAPRGPADVVPSRAELQSSFVAAAEGAEVGELFAYTAAAPVTIERNRAALVPILQADLGDSPRVLVYRQSVSTHPSHAVYLRNSTDLTLELGPVTVFEAGTCAGEALLPRTLKAGMRSMLPYALDTAVEVEPHGSSGGRPVTRGVLARGVLTLQRTQRRETRYEVRNKSGEARTLYIDHPAAGGDFRLVQPAKAHDELPGLLRFEVALAADGDAELLVREVRPISTQIQIQSQSVDQVKFYAEQPYLSDAARAFLREAAGVMDQLAKVEARSEELSAERKRLSADQQTVRQNLQVLRDGPQERALRDKYVARLTQAIERTDAIDEELRGATAQRAELEARLTGMLRSFAEKV